MIIATIFAWVWTNKASILAVVLAILTTWAPHGDGQLAMAGLTTSVVLWAIVSDICQHRLAMKRLGKSSVSDDPIVPTVEQIKRAMLFTGETASPGGLRFPITGTIGALALLLAMAGCSTASAPFRLAVHAVVPQIVKEGTAYVSADATIDDQARSARLNELSQLSAAVADTNSITVAGVQSPWSQVEPFMRAYILKSPKLDGDEKTLRLGNLSRVDADIAAEEHRPFSPTVTTGAAP